MIKSLGDIMVLYPIITHFFLEKEAFATIMLREKMFCFSIK